MTVSPAELLKIAVVSALQQAPRLPFDVESMTRVAEAVAARATELGLLYPDDPWHTMSSAPFDGTWVWLFLCGVRGRSESDCVVLARWWVNPDQDRPSFWTTGGSNDGLPSHPILWRAVRVPDRPPRHPALARRVLADTIRRSVGSGASGGLRLGTEEWELVAAALEREQTDDL